MLNVLVVEDEALLALDLETMIEDCGHRVVGGATSLDEVVELDETLPLDLAFVDVQLARGTSGLDVARDISRRWPQAMIVFVTANPLKIPPDYAGAHGVIPKPFSRSGIVAAMRYLAEGVFNPPPSSPRPASFVPAPTISQTWG